MNLINTLIEKLPFGGEPKSDIKLSDFETENNSSNESPEGDSTEGEGDGNNRQENSSEFENSSVNTGENEKQGDIESLKNKMEKVSAEKDMSDWYDTNSDYTDTADFVENYYENYLDNLENPETDIEIRKEDRDKRVENKNCYVPHAQVLEKYESKFEDDIVEAFRQIKTRESPKAAEHGQRINTRGVIRRRAGDLTEERLYLEMDQSEVGDRCITVVVDVSGSMNELEVKLALLSISKACEQIGDRFTAVTYSTDRCNRHRFELENHLITGPTEKFKPEHLDGFTTVGYTPTASGIKDGREISQLSPNSEDVIIVITDGLANITLDKKFVESDTDTPAMKDANKQYNAAVNEGKRVIGVGVGEHMDDKAMSAIFNDSYFLTEMDEISETLIDIYKKQMKSINTH